MLSASEFEGNLEGSTDVALAPVRGTDNRRSLPKSLFERRPLLFVQKTVFAWGLIALASSAISFFPHWYVVIPAILVNGLIGAHLVELQHECLHGHAFRSAAWNRWFGAICGLFMMSSHFHYRYDHLRHHAYLGTEKNLEHFNYRFSNLDSVLGFVRAFFDLGRFKRVFGIAWRGLTGAPVPGIDKENYAKAVKEEYVLYVAILLASVIYTVVTRSWFFALAWWIPALLISEGVHFLIEMPEHFGLNTQSDPNVLTNCRTIRTSKIVQWFVNGNDVHTAHHYHHGVPMCNVRELNKLIEPQLAIVERSYHAFYWDVICGRIKHNMDVSYMKR